LSGGADVLTPGVGDGQSIFTPAGTGPTVYDTTVYAGIEGHTVNFPSYSVPLGGSGAALNKVQPTLILSCIIKH
jgi:hypothetical protein